jgi:hypothetical protein
MFLFFPLLNMQLNAAASDPFTRLNHFTESSDPETAGGGCGRSNVEAVGILRVSNVETLITEWDSCPAGSLAFAMEEEDVLIRVGAGWQYLLVRNLTF